MCYNGGMRNIPLFLLSLSAVLSAFAAPSADELLKAVPAECSDAAYLQFNLEKAVAVTRTPRAEPISLAETRRRGEFESYVKCSVKVRLHPIGEGNLLCGQSHKFQFHLGIHRTSASPRDAFAVELPG